MQNTFLLALLIPLYYALDPFFENIHNDCCEDDCFKPRKCNLKLGDALLTGENSRRYRADTKKCVWNEIKCDDSKECIVPCIVRCSTSAPVYKPADIDMYIRGVYCFLHANGCKPKGELREMICLMFRCFKGDVRRVTILLAHCIHNTSGFQYLIGKDECKQVGVYISRGILQVRGEENYRRADKEGYFVKNPASMASLDALAIQGALNVYVAVVNRSAQLTFIDSWIALKPLEVQGTNYQQEHFRKIIIGRLNVYFALCQTLGLPVYLGPTAQPFLSFCEPYMRRVCDSVNACITLTTSTSSGKYSSGNDYAPRYTPNVYSGTTVGYGAFECSTSRSYGRSASDCGRTPFYY